MKQKLFIITGPTASAKTDVALYISRQIGAEIISADSMQVYRGMDVGTAKATLNTRRLAPHHLIDIVDPWESYNLGRYVNDAKTIISEITKRDRPSLIVGGTGLYIRGLIHGVFDGPEADWEIRTRLRLVAQEKGIFHLHHLLEKVDPLSAASLHPKDQKRIIRALEVYEKTGIGISRLQTQHTNQDSEFDYLIFVINRPKDDLHKRIDNRVEKMFEDRLVDEVAALMKNPNGLSKQAQQALGYKEILRYLNSELGLQQTKDLIKQDTRKFAKRQMTWFKSFHNTCWIDAEPDTSIETLGHKILRIIVNND